MQTFIKFEEMKKISDNQYITGYVTDRNGSFIRYTYHWV